MRLVLLAALGMTALAACQPATTEFTDEQKAEIAAEVDLLHNQLWDALRSPDFDRISQFWHHTPDVIFAADGAAIFGYATIDSVFRPVVANWASQELVETEYHTVVLSPDVVYTMWVGTDAVTLSSGETNPATPVIDTFVWTRRNGEWKVLLAHESHGASENP